MISFEDFKKVDIRAGEILSAERVPDTDKLIKLSVDLGEESPRQIVSGIAEYFPEVGELVGLQCMFVANLEPRDIRGIESQGMILAINTQEGDFSLVIPRKKIKPGASAS